MTGVIVGAMTLPAGAAITAPASGAVVHGTVTVSDDGQQSKGVNCTIATSSGSTTMFITNAGGTNVDALGSSSNSTGAAPFSAQWETDLFTNGTYHVNSTEQPGKTICLISVKATNATETVTVTNVGGLVYGGAAEAAQGQTIPVKATLTDQSGVAPPNGTTVSFALSDGTTVSGTTTAGVATANLPIAGPPRAATLTVSYAGGFFTSASDPVAFTVGQDPSSTAVSTSPAAFGQSATFTASVSPTLSSTPPTGTVQFTEDGTNYGSPITISGSNPVSISDATLSAGNHTIGAVYSGDTNYLGSSNTANQVITPAMTSTSISSSVINTKFGQAVHFTATVGTQAPGAGFPDGNVTFTETPTGGTAQPIGGAVAVTPTGTANVSTATSADIAVLPAGSYTITANFAGSQDYAASSGPLTEIVSPALTVTTVVSSTDGPAGPGFSVFGQAVQFTATVVSLAPGAGVPTGSIDFLTDGNDLGAVALSGGQATSVPISTLSTTIHHVITAKYINSDGNYTGSTGTEGQFVLPDPTTTVISSAPNPSVFGQAVTFSATVNANAPGAGTPTGAVQFAINGVSYGPSVNLVNGAATAPSDSALVPGMYTISATYFNSDGNYAGSGAGGSSVNSATQVVKPDPTTTVLGADVNPTVSGQTVTFTATVSANAPGAGTPTGTVTFFDGATPIGSGTLNAADQVTTSLSSLSVGTHAISANYGGDPDFVTSNGSLTQIVNQASSLTTVTPTTPVVQGQPVAFTVTVTPVAPATGTPTGTVQFILNGSPLGAPASLSPTAQATSPTISTLNPGTYHIDAVYSGDTDFLTSTGSAGQPVQISPTTTSLVASPSPGTLGQPVTITATVTPTAPGAGTPTGSITFFDGTNIIGSGTLSGGSVSMTTSTLSQGAHSLHASYSGEFDFSASVSPTIAEAVGVIPTQTALTGAPAPSSFGQAVTFTATVSPVAPSTGTPTGTVTFTQGSTTLGTAPLAVGAGGDKAALTVSNLPVGADPITATYSGDTNYGTSSKGLTQNVGPAATTLSAAAATVQGVVSATLLTPFGPPIAGQVIRFTAGSTFLCQALTNSAGAASCSANIATILLDNGYTATYAVTTDYLGSTAHGAS
jgi:hypothetical protein